MNTHLYLWCEFAWFTVATAIYFGLPQPLARAMLAVCWFLMLLVLIFGGRLG